MTNPLDHKRLAVLGAGKMGGILLRAFLNQQLVTPSNVVATVKHGERAAALDKELGIRVSTDNRAAAHGAEVLDEIRPEVTPKTLVVSAVASLPTKFIEQHLADNVPVVRAMPNTPCAI